MINLDEIVLTGWCGVNATSIANEQANEQEFFQGKKWGMAGDVQRKFSEKYAVMLVLFYQAYTSPKLKRNPTPPLYSFLLGDIKSSENG